MKTSNQQSAHGRTARPAPPQHPTDSPTTKRVTKCVDCGIEFAKHKSANSRCVRCPECAKRHKRTMDNLRIQKLMQELDGVHGGGMGKKSRLVTYAEIRRRASAVKVEGGWRGQRVAGGNAPAALARGW